MTMSWVSEAGGVTPIMPMIRMGMADSFAGAGRQFLIAGH